MLQKELGEASVCLKNKTTLNLLFELTQKVKIGKKQGAFCKTELHLRLKKAALKSNYNLVSLLFDIQWKVKTEFILRLCVYVFCSATFTPILVHTVFSC